MGWARVAVWARPSKVRTDALHSKGLSLTSHLPATGSYLTWGLSVFKEEVVWLYESCCRQYRWRNATLPEFMALTTLSRTASTFNPRIDSHHGGTWDSPVGKPRGKASCKNLDESHRFLHPREGKHDTAATAREESARA